INLTGVLTNPALLLDNNKGSWNLQGGTINGGTITATGSNALIGNGSSTLNGVTFDGTGGNNVSPLDMQSFASINILGNLTLKGVVVHMGSIDGGSFGRFFFIGASRQTIDGTAANPATLLFGSNGNNALTSNSGSVFT